MKELNHAGMSREFPHTDLILPLSAVLFSVVWILDSFVFRFSAEFAGFVPDILQVAPFIGLEISAIALGVYSHNALFSKNANETHFKKNKTTRKDVQRSFVMPREEILTGV